MVPHEGRTETSLEGIAAPPTLQRARRIAHVMDGLLVIPGTRIRVGLDPILGLIPGGGDVVAWAASLHLVWAGWRLGATPATLVRMSGHVLLDALIGIVPLAGDLFDVVWRANDRNLRILEALHADPVRARRSSRLWLAAVVAVPAVALGGVAWAAARVVGALLGVVG